MQVEAEPLGELPNSGLLLPAVAPDGRWAACLEWRGTTPPPLDALLAGEPLEPMALVLRALTPGGQTQTLCESAAGWPAWSADGSRLAFVSAAGGRCDLCVYRVADGTLGRHSLPASATMLALSDTGDRAAWVAPGTGTALYATDPAAGISEAAPLAPGRSAAWPQWTPDGRVVYLETDADAGTVRLAHWGPGRFAPEPLCATDLPDTPTALFQAVVALARPLSPDGRQFAVYDASLDQVTLLTLRDGARVALPPGMRAGCWLGPGRFVAAGDAELRLFSGGEGSALLMRGRWLPRGATPDGALIACTRGTFSRSLAVVRMIVRAGE